MEADKIWQLCYEEFSIADTSPLNETFSKVVKWNVGGFSPSLTLALRAFPLHSMEREEKYVLTMT